MCLLLQQKLELITGAAPSSMKLDLRTKDAKPVAPLNDDRRTLQEYNVQVRAHAHTATRVEDGMIVHVTDVVSTATADVAKYEMSDDAYNKRDGRSMCPDGAKIHLPFNCRQCTCVETPQSFRQI
jgi:hypothetical protein